MTNATSAIQLVCFDWGGVILEICESWDEAFRCAGFDPAQFPVDDGCLAQWARLGDDLHGGRLDDRAFCEQVATAIGASVEQVEAVHRAWLKQEYPGIATVVEELLALDGVETGLLSNTSAGHYALQQPGPQGEPAPFPTAGRLRHRVASHLAGVAKPDPAIYEAYEAASGFRGDQIVFFDDLAANVAAARARGWHAQRIDPRRDPARQVREALARYGVLPG